MIVHQIMGMDFLLPTHKPLLGSYPCTNNPTFHQQSQKQSSLFWHTSPFSDGFPMGFMGSYGFPMVFLWFSHGFHGFLWFWVVESSFLPSPTWIPPVPAWDIRGPPRRSARRSAGCARCRVPGRPRRREGLGSWTTSWETCPKLHILLIDNILI